MKPEKPGLLLARRLLAGVGTPVPLDAAGFSLGFGEVRYPASDPVPTPELGANVIGLVRAVVPLKDKFANDTCPSPRLVARTDMIEKVLVNSTIIINKEKALFEIKKIQVRLFASGLYRMSFF